MINSDLSLVFSQSKEYETIAQKREILYINEEKALNIVKDYIINKKRIIYGGMAIDLALKLAGDPGIYSNDVIPDYDFMSPTPYEDSIELSNILYNAKLPMVSAINASHVTTRRVRVQFKVVADITYIPPEIFEKLPYLISGDFRIIHPIFQRMDFHHAFSFPFENPPLEVVYARGSKDSIRFRLLDRRYPIRPDKKSFNKAQKESNEAIQNIVSIQIPQNCIIAGQQSYALLYDLCDRLLNSQELLLVLKKSGTIDLLMDEFNNCLKVAANIDDKNIMTIKLPKTIDPLITLISDSPMEIFPQKGSSYYGFSGSKKYKPIEYKIIDEKLYHKYLDLKPPCRALKVRTGETTVLDVEILDNNGSQIPVFDLFSTAQKVKQYIPSLWTFLREDSIKIVTVHHTLTLFLLNYFTHPVIEQRNAYLNMYYSLMRMVWIAEQIFIAIKNEDQKKAEEFLSLPFFLSANTYGEHNWSLQYIVACKEKQGITGLRPPFGYYPDKNVEPPEFDVSKSPIFHTDGKKTEKFDDLTL